MKAWWLTVALLLAGCAHDNARLAALQTLDDPSKELLSKYRQFFTELQMDRFLASHDFETRVQFIESLKINERIAQYPKPVQDAIWSQTIIAGMDKPAVLMTWGSPDARDIDEGKAEQGVENERWIYNRGDSRVEVEIVNGYVTEVREARR